jgi:hypothetical protein
MANTMTCAYTAKAWGTIPVATVASSLAAVPLDSSLYTATGLTLKSDTTAAGSTSATRTIVLNRTATFNSLFTTDAAKIAAVSGWMTKVLAGALLEPISEATPTVDVS